LPARLVTENLGRRISGRTDLDPAVQPVLDQFYSNRRCIFSPALTRNRPICCRTAWLTYRRRPEIRSPRRKPSAGPCQRRAIQWKRLLPFLIGGVIGVPIGGELLRWTAPGNLRLLVGAILVIFSLWNLFRPNLAAMARAGVAADGAVGVVNGMIGGATGLAGIAVVIWCSLRGWPPPEQRAVFQPSGVAVFRPARTRAPDQQPPERRDLYPDPDAVAANARLAQIRRYSRPGSSNDLCLAVVK
jgi:Sulfite exporter TauE/SafE